MEETVETVRRFHIDAEYIALRGRSFDDLVAERMCESARRQVGQVREERVPQLDEKTGKVTFEKRTVARTPLQLIRDYCAEDRSFIGHDLPLMEGVFRVFLATANQPLSIAELRERIADWPLLAERLRVISDGSLQLMFARDRFYGIRPILVPGEAS